VLKNTKILLIAVILLSTASVGSAQADEKKLQTEDKNLGFTFRLDYMSKWMSRGRECYSEDGAFAETIGIDLWQTGFGVAVTHRNATDSGWVNRQRLDYKVSYGNSLFDSTPYKVKYKVGYVFKNWYDKLANSAGKSKDTQMWLLKSSFPKLLGSTGVVPYVVTTYDHPAYSDDGYGKHWDGWVHRFGLGYDLKVPRLPNKLHLTSEIAYTDGFRAADHDWSYATLGISTKFKLYKNITLVPRVYHQITMDDSVGQRKDITYGIISLIYKFGNSNKDVKVNKDELLLGKTSNILSK